MARTVMQALDSVVREHGTRPALRHKRGGVWRTLSWQEYRERVRLTARGFIKLGLEVGKGVAIIGFNCPQWLMADVGAIFAGGIPAGIYTTNSPEQCQYITEHCEAQVAVVENAEQLAKFKQVRDQLPELKALVMMFGSDPDPDVHAWEDLLRLGEEVPESELEARIEGQKPADLCTLIYTSGTTGPPKAVMISHHNLTWMGRTIIDAVKPPAGADLISYLPLSHIAEQVVSVHAPMLFGGCVWFAESIEKLGENLGEVTPQVFFAVPRVWEKIQAKIQAAGAQTKGLKKKIAAWARRKGLAGGYAEQRGDVMPFLYGLADTLVFSKVREKLGLTRAVILVSSAAPISKETLEFFLSLGVRVNEVYGMSEATGPITISLPTRYRTGKVGYALPGTEIKVADDGEICTRGPHVFLGYFKNEEATAAALDEDGWLHTGDVGELDSDGFLQITDRKKDLLITAGGENIAPQVIEGKLKSIPIVSLAVVVGDRRKHLSALLTLDPERLDDELESAGSPATSLAEAAQCAQVRAYVQRQIDEVNEGLARVQSIKKFIILPGEFTIEGGELTPTMKVKRKVVNERYAAEIEAFYAD